MFSLRAFVGVVALAALAGCSRQTPTSPPPPTAAPIRVASLTISGLEAPLVAGTTASLRATARLSDGTDFAVSEGAQWTSGDSQVARVDAQGNIEAVREGETTINAEVKGASASVPVTVVMNMAGEWTITYIPVSCVRFGIPPGCIGRHIARPTEYRDWVILSQTGDLITGRGWIEFEGRIAPDGRLLLNGRQCYTSDHSFDDEIVIRDWEMERTRGTDSFSGRARWDQYNLSSWGSCDGTRSGGIGGDVRIIDFRRR